MGNGLDVGSESSRNVHDAKCLKPRSQAAKEPNNTMRHPPTTSACQKQEQEEQSWLCQVSLRCHSPAASAWVGEQEEVPGLEGGLS